MTGNPFDQFDATAPVPPSVQANPFDAFDQASGNPFDRFDNPFDQFDGPRKSLLNTTWEGLTSGIKTGMAETGETLTAPFAEGAPHQESGYLGQILQTPISEGWNDPNWWVGQIAYGLGKSSPALATGALGTAVGVASPLPGGALVGGAAGFGLGAAVQSLAPAYKQARARGLDHDQAVNEAMAKTGIAGAAGVISGAIPALSVFGKTAGDALRRPISEALFQLFGAQPLVGAAQQVAEAGVEGRLPSGEELAQGYALNVGQGAPPVAVHAAGRAFDRSGRRVGEEAPVGPNQAGPEPGTRHVLGLEEQIADPETGGVSKTVTPSDVTVQGYDPETGLVSLTRDSDGAQLGPMPVEDFNNLRRAEEPKPLPVDDWVPERASRPTEEDIAARDIALDESAERGMGEDTFAKPLRPIPVEEPPVGEVPFAPGLPEERGKRPFMTREPRETTPEFPGMADAEGRMAYEMDVAEEADRRVRSRGPRDLIQFLADEGGIRDEGGELAALDLGRQLRPGDAKLIRDDGRALDYARERAVEGGYLAEDATINDLLDAVSETARGERVFSQLDMGDVVAREEAVRAKADRSKELRERASSLGIDPKNYSDSELRRVVREWEDADRGEAPVTKTPEGAYVATSKDGEPLGAYTSKRKAEEAVADKRQTNDAVEGMALRRAAEVEKAAKAYSEKLPPGKPPKDIDRQTEMLDFRPPAKMRMKDLAVPEAKITFPRTLAMHDRPFAKLFKPVEKREEAQTRNYRDFFWQMKPVGALTKPSRDQVYKAAVLARLQNRNIVPSGGRLVIKNGDQAVINPDTGKPFVGAGETIKLSKEETEAFFALKATMQNVWRRYGEAIVRNAGYDGDLAELRKAARSPEAAKKFLEASNKPETAQTALDLMMAMQDQERAGYIPFQRRGDVMITVMPKATKEMKLSAGDLGGKLEPLHVEFVDTDTLGKSIKGRKFTEADYGKAVTQRIKELKARFKDTGEVMEPRYISEVGAEELSIPALEKLVSGLANKNPDLRNALYNEFLNEVKDKRKAGFRQKSANVPGFSTDFDRMVTEYLHHTARVLPMIEYRNEVGKARQRLIEGETDSKGKKSAPEGSPSVRRFAEKWLQSVDDPGGDFAGLRKAGFLWWLWASPASAVINLTQTPLVTIPVIGKWGGTARAMLETNRIAAQILRPDKMMFSKKQWGTEGGKIVLNIDNLRLPEKEKALLKEWERDGTLQAQVTSDMLGLNIGKSPAFRPMAKSAQKAYEAGASLFGAAEVTNRAIAGLTAYRLALQPAALEKAKKVYKDNQLFQEQFGDKVTPENLAKWAILETQFQGGKINAPELTRGIGAPLAQFKKFTGNYLSLLNRQLRHEGAAGKAASAMMLGALVMAAGLKGLPFAQDLADAADWATEFATGVNPHIEMTIRNWLRDGLEGAGGEHWGRVGSEMLMNGPSRYLTGIDMGQRFGQGDLVPNNPFDVLGPLAGAIAQGYDASSLYKAGQNYQATEKLLPKAIGNVVGATGYQEQGVTTRQGNPVMAPSEFSDADVGKKALGFQPADLARRYENIFDLSKIDADARKATAGFYRRLGRSLALAEDARSTGDDKRAQQFMDRFDADLKKYMERIEDPNRPEWIKFKVNRESLKREIANAMDWSRRFTKILKMMERMASSVGESTSLSEE